MSLIKLSFGNISEKIILRRFNSEERMNLAVVVINDQGCVVSKIQDAGSIPVGPMFT